MATACAAVWTGAGMRSMVGRWLEFAARRRLARSRHSAPMPGMFELRSIPDKLAKCGMARAGQEGTLKAPIGSLKADASQMTAESRRAV